MTGKLLLVKEKKKIRELLRIKYFKVKYSKVVI